MPTSRGGQELNYKSFLSNNQNNSEKKISHTRQNLSAWRPKQILQNTLPMRISGFPIINYNI